jgi:hypothetical protein
MTDSAGLPAPAELRQLVRDILRELVPVTGLPAGGTGGAGGAGGAVRAVRLTTDAELQAFVADVLRLADDPRRRADLETGRLRFTLGDREAGAASAHPACKIEKGAVTERAVLAAAKAGERLVLGPRAVLTPLARDKARALGVRVEKER